MILDNNKCNGRILLFGYSPRCILHLFVVYRITYQYASVLLPLTTVRGIDCDPCPCPALSIPKSKAKAGKIKKILHL